VQSHQAVPPAEDVAVLSPVEGGRDNRPPPLVTALAVRALGDDHVEGTRARVLRHLLIAGAEPRDAARRPVGVGDAVDPSSP
jgi:hypothetical protein